MVCFTVNTDIPAGQASTRDIGVVNTACSDADRANATDISVDHSSAVDHSGGGDADRANAADISVDHSSGDVVNTDISAHQSSTCDSNMVNTDVPVYDNTGGDGVVSVNMDMSDVIWVGLLVCSCYTHCH